MMNIRFYHPADYSAVIDLWREAGLLSPRMQPDIAIPRMANGRSSALFVGLVEGKVAGTVMAGDNGYQGWIQKLAVAKPYRGRGYGKELVKASERWMLARNLSIVHLAAPKEKEWAEAFCVRLGYEKSDRHYLSHKLDKDACEFSKAELDVIVTYLEMVAPPNRTNIPMPAGHYVLLKLNRPSVGFYRYLYNSAGEPWFWTDRQKMPDEEILNNISDKNVEIFVLYGNGEPAGFIELDFRKAPLVNIAYFGLLPQWIGKGLGKYLLHWGIDYVWQKGAEKLTVDTCTLDHPRALAEYQKAGFKPYKQLHKKIIDPRLEGAIPHHLEPILPPALMMKDLA